jgi:protein-disulfide isomerase
MPITRRSLLSMVSASTLFPAVARAADDPRMAPRSIGLADAKVTVTEYFSLTCIHCAAFARETLPQVKSQLIASGKMRLVFGDFPLDRLALTAAQVARALPPDRYDPFIEALLASQDRWAFARNVDNVGEIFKTAALAGMNRATFDAAVADQGLQKAILAEQSEAEAKYQVNSTPTFIIGGKSYPGEMDFATFAKLVDGAGS